MSTEETELSVSQARDHRRSRDPRVMVPVVSVAEFSVVGARLAGGDGDRGHDERWAAVELGTAGAYDRLMGLNVGTHALGPDTASLVVKTYREGLAAKAGHDLIIDVRQWEATLEVGEDLSQSSLQLQADAHSLYPSKGLRGLKPLTDKDREEIRKNIDGKVLGGEPISFRSSAVEAADGGGRVSVRGELTIHGQSRPASFELSVGADGHVTGTAPLVQSEWGIKPYRGLLGALRVRDSLEVVFDGILATD